jgi:hypothetical protein
MTVSYRITSWVIKYTAVGKFELVVDEMWMIYSGAIIIIFFQAYVAILL